MDIIAGKHSIGQPIYNVLSPEEQEFLKWFGEEHNNSFFFDLVRSPERKKALLNELRTIWLLSTEKNIEPNN